MLKVKANVHFSRYLLHVSIIFYLCVYIYFFFHSLGVAVTASIFTLTALSIDRYLAIKAPLSLRRISGKCQATRFLFAIWVLAAIFVGPMLFVRSIYAVTFSRSISVWLTA